MSSEPQRGLGRRLVRDTLLVASGRGVSLIVWLVVTPVILRKLGAEGFAIWSLYFGLTSWIGALDLGFSQLALRQVAAARARDDHAEAGEFATLAALGYLLLGACWLALAPMLCAPVLDLVRVHGVVRPAAEFAFFAAPIAFALGGASLTGVMVLQAYARFDLAAIATLTVTFAQAGGILWALAAGHGLHGVISAVLLAYAVGGMLTLVLIAIGVRGFAWVSPFAAAKRWRAAIAFGGPLQLANVLAVSHQQVDKLLLTRFASLALVSPYELGLRLATTMSSIPQLALSAVAPAAAAMHAREEHARSEILFHRANRYVMVITALVAAMLLGAGPRLLEAWLGHHDRQADIALVGLVLAAVFALATSTAAIMVRSAGRTDLEAALSAVALATHLAVAFVLVPRYALLGAVAATLIGNVVACLFFLARVSRVMHWDLGRTLIGGWGMPTLALGVGMAAGRLLAPMLPTSGGLAGWALAATVAVSSGLVSSGVLLLAGSVSIREMRDLVRMRGVG